MPFRRQGQGSEGSNQPRQSRLSDHCALRFVSVRRRSIDHGSHLTGRVVVVHRSRSSCRERRRPRPQAFDPAEDLGEQGARHRYLGQLEHHVAGVAHDPGADLDQLLAQCGQRPMLDPLRQGQRAQEVGEL